jgi:hypothetical protein
MYGKASATTTRAATTPKHDLIGALRLRSRTDFARLAFGGRSEDAPVGEKEGDERRADENRAEGLQRRQIADPGPTETERHQHERTQAASRCQDRRDAPGGEHAGTVVSL